MRLLVAIDGSDCSLRAVEFAAKLASESDSSLTILNVVPHVKSTKEDVIALMKEELGSPEKAGVKYLENAKKIAEEHGISTVTVLKEGDPVKEILKESENYDVAIVGTHGKGKVEEVLLGSVSETLVKKATVPVTVVH